MYISFIPLTESELLAGAVEAPRERLLHHRKNSLPSLPSLK